MFLFESDLCDEKRLQLICDKLSKRIPRQSINSASAFNFIWQFVTEWKNILQYDDLIGYIYENLGSSKMTRGADNQLFYINDIELKYPLLKDHSDIEIFDLLIAKFIYYYMTRLPIMLHDTTCEGKSFSKKERATIISSCMKEVKTTWFYSHMPSVFGKGLVYNIERDSLKADSMKNQNDRDLYIKDYHWIFSGGYEEAGRLPSKEALTKNQSYLMEKLLDDYFIVFYKSLQSYLAHIAFDPWPIANIGLYLDGDFMMQGE